MAIYGWALFKLIVATREWNAQHGGVYLAISDTIHPNPYFDIPDRDITTTKGGNLTLINPAYMTRLIAKVADKKSQIKLHITSLNLIRSENAPATWETTALKSFEKKEFQEYSEYFDNNGTTVFRYMAPLVTQLSCLKCHAKQGYQVGDIRGGISISFPATFSMPLILIMTHILIALAGSGLIYKYGNK